MERHFQQVGPQTSAQDPSALAVSRALSPSPHLEDEERLRVLVMMAAQELANGISCSGHVYAMTRAGRYLTPAGDLQEIFGGIEQVPGGGGSSHQPRTATMCCRWLMFDIESGEVYEENCGDVRPEPSDPNPAQDQKTPFQPREHEVRSDP